MAEENTESSENELLIKNLDSAREIHNSAKIFSACVPDGSALSPSREQGTDSVPTKTKSFWSLCLDLIDPENISSENKPPFKDTFIKFVKEFVESDFEECDLTFIQCLYQVAIKYPELKDAASALLEKELSQKNKEELKFENLLVWRDILQNIADNSTEASESGTVNEDI